MSAFPKYDRYKDSGVEWLGEIPEHWDCCRNLGVFDERNERGRPDDELLSVTIQHGVIKQTEITAKKDSSNEDKSNYKVLKKGDLAYNKMRAWQGALGISPYDGICSPAYIILQPKNSKLSKYFHYLFRTPQFIAEANRLSYGLCDDMNSLRYDDFKGSHSPLPPDDEVDRIVTFLDRKTTEIDALIAKKQRQIELLDEQKAIRINRAVTKGIVNAEFGMKNEHLSSSFHSTFTTHNSKFVPSGIEWIGDIPEGWEIRKLKHCGYLKGGAGFPPHEQGQKDNELLFFKVRNLGNSQDGRIMGDPDSSITLKTAKRLGAHVFPPDTIVYAKIGAALLLNRRRMTTANCCLDNNMTGFVITAKDISPRWAHRFLSLIDFGTLVNPGPVPSITEGRQSDLPMLVPPLAKQNEILKDLESQERSIYKVMEKVNHEIQSLETLRSTLIAHAVTGRIKVA